MRFHYIRPTLLSVAAFIAIAMPIGCGATPSRVYVLEDRDTYNVVAPATAEILDGKLPTGEHSTTILHTLDRWDDRVASAPVGIYFDADRATNKSISPFVRSVLNGSLPLADVDADEREGKRHVLATWDLRMRGEEGTSS